VRDLLFERPAESPSMIHRYQYGYGAGSCGCQSTGNRTYALATQQRPPDWPGTEPYQQDRSYAYAYDRLNRLIDARLGRLAVDSNGLPLFDPDGRPYFVEPTARTRPRAAGTQWNLDNLGNWSGGVPDASG